MTYYIRQKNSDLLVHRLKGGYGLRPGRNDGVIAFEQESFAEHFRTMFINRASLEIINEKKLDG